MANKKIRPLSSNLLKNLRSEKIEDNIYKNEKLLKRNILPILYKNPNEEEEKSQLLALNRLKKNYGMNKNYSNENNLNNRILMRNFSANNKSNKNSNINLQNLKGFKC